MKSKLATLMCGAALAMTGVHAHAADMADSMTIVSWGGAYQKSQINAYAEPYKAMHPEVEVIWDESSNEAVAKLRAMNEAGNITWDLVDVVLPTPSAFATKAWRWNRSRTSCWPQAMMAHRHPTTSAT
jgi:putative spermidine/putrescine transport system substrate-binding protein